MASYQLNAFADEASNALSGQIAAMARNGVHGLEIRNVDGKNVTELTVDEARAIRERLEAAGLCVWSVGSPLGKIGIKDDFEAHMDLLHHTLALAEALGTKRIRMFSFYMPEGDDPARWREQVMLRLARMAEAAAQRGILLCHENEKGIYGDIAERCRDIHETVPQLRGVFDPANFVQCGQVTYPAWQMLRGYIDYMHVKDALWDGTVVPSGEGDGDVARILSEYLAGGGTALTVEPHLKVFEGLSTLEHTGDARGVGGKYVYPDNDTAFDAACDALRALVGR